MAFWSSWEKDKARIAELELALKETEEHAQHWCNKAAGVAELEREKHEAVVCMNANADAIAKLERELAMPPTARAIMQEQAHLHREKELFDKCTELKRERDEAQTSYANAITLIVKLQRVVDVVKAHPRAGAFREIDQALRDLNKEQPHPKEPDTSGIKSGVDSPDSQDSEEQPKPQGNVELHKYVPDTYVVSKEWHKALLADKARLDWMETDAGCTDGNGYCWYELPWPKGKTLRQAIDAAKEQEDG